MAWRGIHDKVSNLGRIIAASLPQQFHSLLPEPLDQNTRRQH
jgi:hypothetical protein